MNSGGQLVACFFLEIPSFRNAPVTTGRSRVQIKTHEALCHCVQYWQSSFIAQTVPQPATNLS